MLKIKLNLDSEEFKVKPSIEQTQLIQSRIGNEQTEISLEELSEAIGSGQTFKAAALTGNKNEDWESQQIYVLDCDEGITLDEALERCKKYNIMPVIKYHSFSSSAAQEKFRLIFCLDEVTTDMRVRNLIQTALMTIFHESDKSCKDSSRIFYGTDKMTWGDYNHEESVINAYDLVQSVVMYLKDTDTQNNFSRKIKKFCNDVGVNMINGIPLVIKNDKSYNNYFDENMLSSIYNNIEVSTKSSNNDLFGELCDDDYIVPIDDSNIFIYFNTNISILDVHSRKKVKIQNYKNNFKDEEIQNFDFKALDTNCQLWHEYTTGDRHISHQEFFGITTNLWRARGAQKKIIKVLDNNNDYDESYNNKINTFNSVKAYGYKPMSCSKFCPHYDQCQNLNMLQAVNIKRGEIRNLKQPLNVIPLAQAEQDLAKAINNALADTTNAIWVIKAATGLGKSQTIMNLKLKRTSYSYPNHILGKDLYNRFQQNNKNLVYLKKLQLNDESTQKEFEHYQNIGAYGLARQEIEKYRKQLVITSKQQPLSQKEQEDLNSIKTYTENLKKVQDTEELLLTTHEKALNTNNPNIDCFIFDEDIVQSSLMKTIEITVPTIDTLIAYSMSLNCVYTTGALQILKDAILKAQKAPGQPVGVSGHMIKEEEINKILRQYNASIDINLKDVLLISAVCCNAIQQDSSSKKPPIISQPLGIIKREFPLKKCIVLSATANEKIYKALYPGRNIRFIDITNVETAGKLIMHYQSFSRTALKKDFDKAIKKIKDESPNISNLITFAKYENDFKKEGFNVIAHYGAVTGLDAYKGQDLIVAGTPYVNERTYLLYCYCIKPQANIVETMEYKPIKRNGFEFSFNAYNNDGSATITTKILQEIEFYLIESELIQAIGRARILRENCTVHLYSSLPLSGAELYKA